MLFRGETTHYILCVALLLQPLLSLTHWIFRSLCIASLRGPPIGGQDRDGASYRCFVLYTLCLFEAFPSRGNEKIGGTGYCVTYDTDSQSRNADFISIARRAIRNPRPEGPSNLRTLRPSGRSILRTLTPKVCPRAIHNPRGQRPRQTYEPMGPKGPSILRTFFPQPFYTTCLR